MSIAASKFQPRSGPVSSRPTRPAARRFGYGKYPVQKRWRRCAIPENTVAGRAAKTVGSSDPHSTRYAAAYGIERRLIVITGLGRVFAGTAGVGPLNLDWPVMELGRHSKKFLIVPPKPQHPGCDVGIT
jgi:hypothetical protein